jgi:hypothetical protein
MVCQPYDGGTRNCVSAYHVDEDEPMTPRQETEEIKKHLAVLQGLLSIAPDDMSVEMNEAVDGLAVAFDTLTKSKCGNEKIFIAIDEKTVIVEGTAAVDVILARSSEPVTGSTLVRETLTPRSESDFLEIVHDTLADSLNRGFISAEEINNKIQ